MATSKGISSLILFVATTLLLFSNSGSALYIEGPTQSTNPGEGVIIGDDITNSTFSNQTDYWGPYHYSTYDYTDWNEAYSWGPMWSMGTPIWIYNDSGVLYFNTSQLSTVYYNATNVTLIAGTVSGGLNYTRHPTGNYDSVTTNITEAAGSPGLDVRINFTNVGGAVGGVMRYYTSTIFGDEPIIQLWDYDDGVWEDYPTVGESTSYAIITQQIYDETAHLQNGIVQMRLYKSANGNVNNHYYIDWLAVYDGFAVPSGEETDPYSWHRNSGGETGNFNTTGNVTAEYFYGNLNYSYIQNHPATVAGNPFNQSLNTTDRVVFEGIDIYGVSSFDDLVYINRSADANSIIIRSTGAGKRNSPYFALRGFADTGVVDYNFHTLVFSDSYYCFEMTDINGDPSMITCSDFNTNFTNNIYVGTNATADWFIGNLSGYVNYSYILNHPAGVGNEVNYSNFSNMSNWVNFSGILNYVNPDTNISNCSALNSCDNIIYSNNLTWITEVNYSNFSNMSNWVNFSGLLNYVNPDTNISNCSALNSCDNIIYSNNVSGILVNYSNYSNMSNYVNFSGILDYTNPDTNISNCSTEYSCDLVIYGGNTTGWLLDLPTLNWSNITNVGNIFNQTLNTTNDVVFHNLNATGNISTSDRITFKFNEFIENIVDGILSLVAPTVNIDGNLNVSENITAQNLTIRQNTTTIIFFGGGKDLCLGNCT